MMDRRDDEALSTLNDLIETCRDGERGFREAAEHLRDGRVRELFDGFSRQRREFASELEQELRRLGGEPPAGGTVTGAMHRGWMDVKSAVTGRDDKALVSEAERGEDAALRRYQDALNTELPRPVRSTVQRQYTEVRQAHDRVRALERAFEHEDEE